MIICLPFQQRCTEKIYNYHLRRYTLPAKAEYFEEDSTATAGDIYVSLSLHSKNKFPMKNFTQTQIMS